MVTTNNMMIMMIMELNMKMTSFKSDFIITYKNQSNEIKIQTCLEVSFGFIDTIGS